MIFMVIVWLQGLLQSEVEGVDNENVGFYGRCLHHATHPMCESDSGPVDQKTGVSGVEEITCARTEVLSPFRLVAFLSFACVSC